MPKLGRKIVQLRFEYPSIVEFNFGQWKIIPKKKKKNIQGGRESHYPANQVRVYLHHELNGIANRHQSNSQ